MNDVALTFSPGDERWQKYRQRGISDLFFFSSTILGLSKVFPLEAETHLLYCRFLERKTGIPEIDSAPWQKCETPRGTGKTAVGTIADCLRMVCENPDLSILIANERQETADGFLGAIKTQIETNDLLRALYPELRQSELVTAPWAATKATVHRQTNRPEPTWFTIGVGGTVTGTHPDRIIIDDPISKEAMENARVGAWQIMEKVNRWCNEQKLLLNTQAKPFPWIRVNGTRWWKDDTYDYIEKTYGYKEQPKKFRLATTLPNGTIISRMVYRVGDVAVYRAGGLENGQAVYPKIYTLENMAKLQQDDPELFACNILNNPTDAALRTFQDGWLRYWIQQDPRQCSYTTDEGGTRFVLTQDLLKVLIVDPAFTATGSGARAALVLIGTDTETGKHLVLEAKALRAGPEDLVDEVLNMAGNHNCHRVVIESVAQQIGWITMVQNTAVRRKLSLGVDVVKPGGRNKDVRIEGLTAYFRAGAVLIHPSQLDLIREYRAYTPGARYKDLLDALAYGPELWPNLQPGQNRARDQRAELAAYYARRGVAAPDTEDRSW